MTKNDFQYTHEIFLFSAWYGLDVIIGHGILIFRFVFNFSTFNECG
jgi:hypothetical protein